MKRKLLLGALLMGALTTNAQILNGTFEDEAALQGWSVYDIDGDQRAWGVFEAGELSDSWGLEGNYAGSESWDFLTGEGLTPDNYLISPLIQIPESGATLNFLKGHTYYDAEDGAADQLSVYILTADNAQDVTDIPNIPTIYHEVFDTPVPNSQAVAVLETLDLSDYAGQEIAIAFRHHEGYNQDMIFIDSVIVTENTAGRNDALAKQFKIFPNPATSVVNIASPNVAINEVSFTDVNGRVVKTEKVNALTDATVNITGLSAGIYFMKVSSDKGSFVKEVVKN
ncbi:T9SS type A sorting domain-containing protein [Flavobacterium sp. Sd200]|uniref:T9SS-dependent choice-of-anchor J family protein n=1 Tax=Flavobacterium sp. Sd200 TaxID=2692211 RepID=UPI001368DF02|nr:choice-of-anchor J domain-containing protein [Flavobacterium sp. Sd200]MXN93112.1 T9SS type A sorting domain-containing protein [Flavobacterium sp. Sd200]